MESKARKSKYFLKTQKNPTLKLNIIKQPKSNRRLVTREEQLVGKGTSTGLPDFLAQCYKGWKEEEQYIYVQNTANKE